MGVRGGARILGIDPGTQTVGFGCLATRAAELPPPAAPLRLAVAAANVLQAAHGRPVVRVVEAGVLRLGGRSTPVADRLLALSERMDELLARLEVDELAVEEAFYGRSVAAALRIGEARGVVLAAARRRRVTVHQLTPARIKRAVAGHGGASKAAVADMVCRQLSLQEVPQPRDVTDALAAALACCQG